jgi:hypothetical protein
MGNNEEIRIYFIVVVWVIALISNNTTREKESNQVIGNSYDKMGKELLDVTLNRLLFHIG